MEINEIEEEYYKEKYKNKLNKENKLKNKNNKKNKEKEINTTTTTTTNNKKTREELNELEKQRFKINYFIFILFFEIYFLFF